MAIQKGTWSSLWSGRSYMFNYDKHATPSPSTLPFASPSLVVPTGRNVNPENVNADAHERPITPFKYDIVKHLR